MNATPTFGPLAIPVFLEKISVGSRTTKVYFIAHFFQLNPDFFSQKDTLQTLTSCLPIYGSALARVSARKLWNALKLEVRGAELKLRLNIKIISEDISTCRP